MKTLKEIVITCRFSKHDINKFILLLWGVKSYEYMDDWGQLIKTLLSQNEFYSRLNMKGITDTD